MRPRPAWNSKHTLGEFYLTGALLGPLLAANMGLGARRWLTMTIVAAAGAQLLNLALKFLWLVSSDTFELKATARLLSMKLRSLMMVRSALLVLGGIVLPGANVSAAAGGALLTFGSEAFGWESRIYGAFFNVEDEDTKTEGAAFFWHSTRWWGVYGLGFGSGVGYADFTAKTIYGWNDTSGQLLAYIAPVMLRFGRQPTFELGLNSGATLFFSHDVRPYGYAYGGILF